MHKSRHRRAFVVWIVSVVQVHMRILRVYMPKSPTCAASWLNHAVPIFPMYKLAVM